MESPSKGKTSYRLNILALPSQTTILFTLIFLVIGAPILLSAAGRSAPCGPAIIVGIVTFTTWNFLGLPDRYIRKYRLTDAATAFPEITTHLHHLATEQAKLTHPPRLMLSPNQEGIYSFGTFTRRYIVISESLARTLKSTLSEPDRRDRADAILLHELAHFRNGDVWKALLSRSLLIVTTLFFVFSFFNNLLIPFLYYYGARFYISTLSPTILEMFKIIVPETGVTLEELPPVGPQAILRYEAYVLGAHWPLIIGSILLLLLFWRRLLKLRELYADARVVTWQGTAATLLKTIPWVRTLIALRPAPPLIKQRATGIAFGIDISPSPLRKILSPQPDAATRRLILQEPYRIYGEPRQIAMVAGFTVILLNLTLSSLFASRFIRGPNATFPLAVGFLLLAVSTLPLFLRKSTQSSKLIRSLGGATLVFTIIRMIPQVIASVLLILVIILSPEIIDQSAYALLLIGGENLPTLDIPPALIIEIYVIRPLLFSALVIPPLLFLLLLCDLYLKREILSWYSAPLLRKQPATALWIISGVLTALATLGILPVANALILPTAHSLSSARSLIGFGLLMPILIISPIVFWRGCRRYAHRCPSCNKSVPGHYFLGRRCDHCGCTLHPKLVRNPVTPYETPSPEQ